MSKLIKILHAYENDTIHILAYTTGICNYLCKYCSFSSMKNFKYLNLEHLYNFLVELHLLRKQKIYIELIGGEPTLDANLLEFSTKVYLHYPKIRLGIYTNFSQCFKLYEALDKNYVDLTLTWHSLPNDRQNLKFIDNAKHLLSIHTNDNIDVHIMYEKYALAESIIAFNQLVELYPHNVELCLLDRDFTTNKIYFLDNYFYTKEDLDRYCKLTKKQKFLNNKIIYEAYYDDESKKILSVQEVLNSSESYDFRLWKCDAGKNYMYIDITGNIYPCFNYCNEKTNIIGNIYNVKDIKFKLSICKYSNCPCVWEAYKERLFK